MNILKQRPNETGYPERLRHISGGPAQLYSLGALDDCLKGPTLAIVGSRKITPYGKQITEQLAREAAQQGITIISGLALGVDGYAHRAALEVGGNTIAVLPCGLDKFYPSSHQQLAQQILHQGGAIVSEYPEDTPPFKTNFIARNRIVTGLADAVLITEAAGKSGTLHTANFALEQGKTVMAVPGNITSEQSRGTNSLIKMGAAPVTEMRDILAAMGLEQLPQSKEIIGSTPAETTILSLLDRGTSDGGQLLAESGLSAADFNQALTMLEIRGVIRPLGAGHWGTY